VYKRQVEERVFLCAALAHNIIAVNVCHVTGLELIGEEVVAFLPFPSR
jgi:hypothetical protein